MEHAQVIADRTGSGDNNSITGPSDSLGVSSIVSADSGMSVVSGYSEHTPGIGIVRVDSAHSNGNGSSSQAAAHSPQRSIHSSAVSSPGSTTKFDPAQTLTPQTMSPVIPHVPALSDYSVDGVLLGVQQLERQQLELERRRYVGNPITSDGFDLMPSFPPADDDHTEPSSTVTGTTGGENPNVCAEDATSTFGRLVHNTRRRIGSGDRPRSGSEGEDVFEGALIYGYLQKLGRNGKWQTRWFETDGECLTYYKSSKRQKLLATLDLAKVGSIVVNNDDPKGTSFTINISERPYHLRADGRASCKDWVITLNRVKEARMQQGNVKILMPSSDKPVDLLDQDETLTPRVVVVANRQRTRAVDEEVMQAWEQDVGWVDNPAQDPPSGGYYGDIAPTSSSRLANWQKSRTSMSRIASKLLRWARSLKKFSCMGAENHVMLDSRVHPPGHDYKHKLKIGSSDLATKKVLHSSWIGKESELTDSGVPTGSKTMKPKTLAHSSSNTSSNLEEEETRYLS